MFFVMKVIFQIMAVLWLVGLPVALLDYAHANPGTREFARQFDGSWKSGAMLAIYYGALLVIGHAVTRRRINRLANSPEVQRDIESIRRRIAGERCADPDSGDGFSNGRE